MPIEFTPGYEMVKYFPLVKVDSKQHTVFGIASCEIADKDGEIADYDGTKKAYQDWSTEALESTTGSGQQPSLGNIRYMHKLILAGKATKLQFDDVKKQIWVESTPAPPISKEDPDIWPLLEGGFLRGYSHGGKYASRVCNECRKDIQGNFCEHCNKRVVVRYTPILAELSWVDNPCLKQATFTLVKSDGSMEVRKFASPPPLPPPAEGVKTVTKCNCKCANCGKGDCSACSADQKCSMAAGSKSATTTDINKEVKYLVESGGDKHLPYTDSSGKPNHRLMGAAWAALHGGYRGNKYAGPGKQAAIRRLKQVYAREGMDTPAEKAEKYGSLIKSSLETSIQRKAYGYLGKGLYTVSRYAELMESLKYLCMSIEYEAQQEGGDDADVEVSDTIKEALSGLLDSLLTYTENQIEEVKEGFAEV